MKRGSLRCPFSFHRRSDRVDLVLVAPDTFDKLQVIVLRKVEDEAVCHGLDLVEPTIHENRFFGLVLAGADIRLSLIHI